MKLTSIAHVFWFTCCVASAQSFTNSGISGPDFHTGYTARGGATSITQNSDTATIVPLNSVACPADNDNYYRRFDLDGAHGITGDFNITDVDFGVEEAGSLGGTQPITVNLYSIDNAAPLVLANLTLVGSAAISLADGSGFIQNALAAGVVNGSTDDLVVEVVANDTTNASTFFFGSNAAGQSAPSFILSAGCGATEPTDIASLGFPGMHIIMIVNGTVGGGGGEVPAGPVRELPISAPWALALLGLGLLLVSRRKLA